ncbi:MAG: molybdopterin molybdotransferase MoeA [Mycobacteriales bacterium]
MRTAWTDARLAAHAAPTPLPVVPLPLARAAGVLAAPLRAATPVPAFDCSAMDGYAVGSLAGRWRVVGRVLAGPADPGGVGPGEAVEVATGAPVPAGTVAVLPVELTAVEADELTALAPPEAGRHVRRVGEDLPLGLDLLPAGTPVTPTVVGLAAAGGLDAVQVRPPPRVAALLTGDELVHAGGSGGGLVRDAVGPALPGWVRALGGEPLPACQVPDTDAATLVTAIRRAGADVVLTSGGAGAGPADRVAAALHDLGARVVVDGVDCRPGHPQRLAELPDGRWLVALPGNPYAALVAALTLLGPLLRGLTGRPLPDLPLGVLDGAAHVTRSAGPTRILPVRRRPDGTLEPLGRDRPGNLWGAALADAFAVLPAGWRGEPVPLLAPPA